MWTATRCERSVGKTDDVDDTTGVVFDLDISITRYKVYSRSGEVVVRLGVTLATEVDTDEGSHDTPLVSAGEIVYIGSEGASTLGVRAMNGQSSRVTVSPDMAMRV